MEENIYKEMLIAEEGNSRFGEFTVSAHHDLERKSSTRYETKGRSGT